MSERMTVKKSNITALVTCVDYSDFLAVSLPRFMKFFSECIVVTTPEDNLTQQLCQQYGAKAITTDAFWKNGSVFNKAAGLNNGLEYVKTDFICALDADILLPDDFEDVLAGINNSDCLYGMNRVIYKTIDDLNAKSGEDRFMPAEYIIGFFQLFNRKSKYFPGRFNETYKTSYHYDIEFMMNWPANMRRRLSEEPLSHIGERTVNWAGRTGYGPQGEKFHNKTHHLDRQALKDILEYLEKFKFKLTYFKKSEILLLQNISKETLHHVRLDVGDNHRTSAYRFGTILAGNFVELPMVHEPEDISDVKIKGITETGKSILESKLYRMGDEVL